MKLQRLRIENFKLFRAPLEIDGFTDGLNLFAAPNALQHDAGEGAFANLGGRIKYAEGIYALEIGIIGGEADRVGSFEQGNGAAAQLSLSGRK